MRENRRRRLFAVLGASVVILASAAWPGQAADLDRPYDGGARAPRVITGTGPRPVYRAVERQYVLPPNCRLIAQPQFNLSRDDVVRARPQMICMSRGIYADSFYR